MGEGTGPHTASRPIPDGHGSDRTPPKTPRPYLEVCTDSPQRVEHAVPRQQRDEDVLGPGKKVALAEAQGAPGPAGPPPPTDLLAGVGGDGQAVGQETGHLVLFDHLHGHHRNGHLRVGAGDDSDASAPTAPEQRATGPGRQAGSPTHTPQTRAGFHRVSALAPPMVAPLEKGLWMAQVSSRQARIRAEPHLRPRR